MQRKDKHYSPIMQVPAAQIYTHMGQTHFAFP